MTTADAVWEQDRRIATDYGRQRLTGCDHFDPAEFGMVWANMRRGHRTGELRERPCLTEAFDEWLEEQLTTGAAHA